MPLFKSKNSQSSNTNKSSLISNNSSYVTISGTSPRLVSGNCIAYGWAANITSTYKISLEQTLAENMFARFFPIIKELSQKEPTLSEVNQVYFQFLEYFDRYNSYKQSFEKQKERNQAIFDLIKGNAAIYLIYSKSEDSFISEFSKLLIKHIPI